MDESSRHLWYLIFYFQGEPYLHPQFTELVSYASKKNIYTATSTNAHYLTDVNARKTVESGLDRLIISIDGTTQEVYEQYRVGGKLDEPLSFQVLYPFESVPDYLRSPPYGFYNPYEAFYIQGKKQISYTFEVTQVEQNMEKLDSRVIPRG